MNVFDLSTSQNSGLLDRLSHFLLLQGEPGCLKAGRWPHGKNRLGIPPTIMVDNPLTKPYFWGGLGVRAVIVGVMCTSTATTASQRLPSSTFASAIRGLGR